MDSWPARLEAKLHVIIYRDGQALLLIVIEGRGWQPPHDERCCAALRYITYRLAGPEESQLSESTQHAGPTLVVAANRHQG